MRHAALSFVALTASAQVAGAAAADAGAARGGEIWLATCSACHANPLSDAPQVKDKAAWALRLAKGAEALYASALNGRVGKDGAEMPPRGGNASLTDAEVKAAVNHIISITAK